VKFTPGGQGHVCVDNNDKYSVGVTRAFGFTRASQVGVIAEPDLSEYMIQEND
jgi:hypothetical protein